MEQFPDKPKRSAIEEVVDSDGITLRWWPPAAGFLHYATAAVYAGFFCVWVGAYIAAVVSMFSQPVGFFTCGMVAVLCVLTYAGASLGYAVWALLAPDRPASVRLEAEWLRYHSERSKVAARLTLLGPWGPKGKLPPRPRSLAARRPEIRGLVLDRDLWRTSLTLDCETDRVGIGTGLDERDLEWLHAVLQRWSTQSK